MGSSKRILIDMILWKYRSNNRLGYYINTLISLCNVSTETYN